MNGVALQDIVIMGADIDGLTAALFVAQKFKTLNVKISVVDLESELADNILTFTNRSLKFYASLGLTVKTMREKCRAEVDLGFCDEEAAPHIFNDFDVAGVVGGIFINDLIACLQSQGKAIVLDDLTWYGRLLAQPQNKQHIFEFLEHHKLSYGVRLAQGLFRDSLRELCAAQNISIVKSAACELRIADKRINAVMLDNAMLPVDLLVDASPNCRFMAQLEGNNDRRISFPIGKNLSARQPNPKLGYFTAIQRIPESVSLVSRVNKCSQITVYSFCEKEQSDWFRREEFWCQNCLAVGAGAINVPAVLFDSVFMVQQQLLLFAELWPQATNLVKCGEIFNRIVASAADQYFEVVALIFSELDGFDINKYFPQLVEKIAFFQQFGKISQRDGDVLSRVLHYKLFNFIGVRQRVFDPRAGLLSQQMMADFVAAGL